MNYDSTMNEEAYRDALRAICRGYTFDEWAAEYGWDEWMEEYTEAPDGEPCSEAELNVIDKVMRNIWADAVKEAGCFIDKQGNVKDYAAAVALMDDELREELNSDLAPCSNQEFIEAYAKAHEEKYGEGFAPYVGGTR